MGRLIDVDKVKKKFPIMENDFGMVINERLHKHLDEIPTVDAIPRERIEQMEKDIDEMQAWGDNFGDIYLSYDKVKEIIHKYTKEQGDNT